MQFRYGGANIAAWAASPPEGSGEKALKGGAVGRWVWVGGGGRRACSRNAAAEVRRREGTNGGRKADIRGECRHEPRATLTPLRYPPRPHLPSSTALMNALLSNNVNRYEYFLPTYVAPLTTTAMAHIGGQYLALITITVCIRHQFCTVTGHYIATVE